MKKINRTPEEAQAIAKRKIYKYILALQIIYAKRISSLNGAAFDADLVESSLTDAIDKDLYFQQQNDIRRSFCIHRDVWMKFTKIRFEGGTRVQLKPIMDDLQKFLRVKSYNTNGSASYKVGGYSKMYIFNYDSFIELCNEWHNTTEYSQKFDLGSEYYKEIIDELKKRFNLKFLDFNKYSFRKDGSNV